MSQHLELEEDRVITRFQQKIQKARDTSWHDRKIKHKVFQVGYLVLIYENKFVKHPRKL